MIPLIVSLLALGGLLLLSAAWLISDSLAERPLPMLTFQLCNREATLSGPVRVGSLGMACQDSRSNPFSGAPLLGSGLIAAWAVGSG